MGAKLRAGDGAVERQRVDLLPGREADRRLLRDEAVADVRSAPPGRGESPTLTPRVPLVTGGRDIGPPP